MKRYAPIKKEKKKEGEELKTLKIQNRFENISIAS